MNRVYVKKLHPEAKLPIRAHAEDAGLDLFSLESAELAPFGNAMVRTGIALELQHGTVGLIWDRSSMAKKGFKTAGGVIDAGYRGEVQVVFRNLTDQILKIEKGDKIAQLLIQEVLLPQVAEAIDLGETQRGQSGFGSTGSV